ncbi:high-affinity zinc uptake system periplasmic-binding protein [Firmicutes bacterium CAG:582]|nr:high-affinity zinc uptake system periplasmic-binding protein [Firmicutes bacterium CAG:582]
MKLIRSLVVLFITLILLTGCFKRDNMDDISIAVTKYPIEYLVKNIYGFNSTVSSVYPVGSDVDTYTLSKKQLRKYSTNDIFVYNGLTDEKKIAAGLLNYNSSIKIIDVAKGLNDTYEEEELWLSPSNYLMLAQNIKDSLLSYINSTILKQEINDAYEELKLNISMLDANIKVIAENANNKTIIVGNDLFKFLEKYGYNVLSIDESKNKKSDYQEAKNLVSNKSNSYVFVLEKSVNDENVAKLKNAGASIVSIKSLKSLTQDEINDGYDYLQYMNTFIDDLKSEVYN